MMFRFLNALLLMLLTAVPVCSFAEVSLHEAYLKALKNDEIIKSAQHSYNATATYTGQTRAGLLPSVSASMKESHYNTDRYDNYKTTETVVGLSQPLFDMSKLYQYRQSDYSVKSAESRYEQSQQELMLRVFEAYINVLYAKDSIDYALSERAASEEQLVQAEKMFKSGLVAVTNVHEAQANLDMVNYNLISAQNSYKNNMYKLEAITGKLDGDLRCVGVGFDFAGDDIKTADYWIKTARESSKDVKYYESMKKYADYNVKINASQFLPSVNLLMNYTKTDSVNNIKSTETTYKSISAQVSVPVFNGGYTYYRLKEAREKKYQAVSDYNSALIKAEEGINEAFVNLVGLKSKIGALHKLTESNRLALDSNNKSYMAGVTTLVDVINAQNNLYDSLVKLSKSRYEYFYNLVSLKFRAGVLAENDIVFLDSQLDGTCKEKK